MLMTPITTNTKPRNQKMFMQEGTNVCNIGRPDWVIRLTENINDVPQLSQSWSSARIHRVSTMVRKTNDYDKYYIPKVLSIGPYHYGNPNLQLVEKLKPLFMRKLLLKYNVRPEDLHMNLRHLVQELRMFYDENQRMGSPMRYSLL